MKINLRTVLFLFGVTLIVSGPCALAHTDVTVEQARELIDSTDDLTVVDVREPSEYSGTRGHIPGALNYPLNSGVLLTRYEELPMHSPVLVVCGSGSRSNRAAKFLDSMDFSMVYDMLGGMNAWIWETETSVDSDSKYGGGTGEPNNPYLIYTAEQLNAIGAEPNDWDKHFKLMADIDLSDYSYDAALIAPDIDNTNDGFQGTSFTGVFDGNDHVISNLTIEGGSYLGLFGQSGTEAEISNLGLKAVDVSSTGDYVGGLVGFNVYSFITNCHSTGMVKGNDDVGGLVGYNFGGVRQCYSNATVMGIQYVGGLVGYNSLSIDKSYSSSIVLGDSSVGGLVGENYNYNPEGWGLGYAGTIDDCYSTGPINGNNNIGGLVGNNETYEGLDPLSVVTRCFWDMEISGQTTSAAGTGLTTAEMQTAVTFLESGWDFVGETENGIEDIWSICEGTNYPRFLWQIQTGDFVCPDGITIDDFFFLLEFWLDDNCDLSNGYCQGTDLDQSGTVDTDDLEIFFENWLAEK